MKRWVIAACAASVYAASAYAQDVPVPKMFKGMQQQKGQYQVEFLEGGPTKSGRKPPEMTLCTDNLMNSAAQRAGPRAAAECTHRLLKDTSDEAVVESLCKERKSTVTLKRESARSMVIDIGGEDEPGEAALGDVRLAAQLLGSGVRSAVRA